MWQIGIVRWIYLTGWWTSSNIPSDLLTARAVPIYKRCDILMTQRITVQFRCWFLLASFCFVNQGFNTASCGPRAVSDAIRLLTKSIDGPRNLYHMWTARLVRAELGRTVYGPCLAHWPGLGYLRTLYRLARLCIKRRVSLFTMNTVHPNSRRRRLECPLSPPVFLLVMTCADDDVRSRCYRHIFGSRIPGIEFDTAYYADDTILFSPALRHHDFLMGISSAWKIAQNSVVYILIEPSAMPSPRTVLLTYTLRITPPLNIAQEPTYLGHKVNYERSFTQNSGHKSQSVHGIGYPCSGRTPPHIRNGNSCFATQ